MWCNEKCICLEENVKLFCRDINEGDLFKNGDATREIELKNSFVGLQWITETFGKLERVCFVESNVLDCNSLYFVRVIGGCSDRSSSDGLKSKGVTSKSV